MYFALSKARIIGKQTFCLDRIDNGELARFFNDLCNSNRAHSGTGKSNGICTLSFEFVRQLNHTSLASFCQQIQCAVNVGRSAKINYVIFKDGLVRFGGIIGNTDYARFLTITPG